MAVRLSDGETVWETARPEFIANFVTPVIWSVAGQRQVVVPGSLHAVGYDLETGNEVWRVRGLSWSVVSTPVIDEKGVLYVNAMAPGEREGAIPLPPYDEALTQFDHDQTGTFNKQEFEGFGPRSGFFRTLDRNKDGEITRDEYQYVDSLWSNSQDVLIAIRPGGRNDITDTHVAWQHHRSLPFCPSPLYYAGHIYTFKDLGIVNCLDADTGKRVARERRISGRQSYYSSPVVGDGKIYIASERGDFSVITAEPDWRELSHERFDEDFYATPAIVDGRIFARTTETLYCFGFPDVESVRVQRVADSHDQAKTRLSVVLGVAGGVGIMSVLWFSRLMRRRKAVEAG
jgi:hypothetical protein